MARFYSNPGSIFHFSSQTPILLFMNSGKMKNILTLPFLMICLASNAQFSQRERDSIAQLSTFDHEQMKKQLGITVPNRPGPSGNPNAPNAANREESRVNKYDLPDPLVFRTGSQVKTAKEWERRRKEIVDDIDREVYGQIPNRPPFADRG